MNILDDEQVREDCIFCMIEERGLQFALPKSQRYRFLRWMRRPEDYKEAIRGVVRKYNNDTKIELFDLDKEDIS